MKIFALLLRAACAALIAAPLAQPATAQDGASALAQDGASALFRTQPSDAPDDAPLDAPSDLPPGLVSAALLPGWITPEGHRMTALSLRLKPGWKTYWRSPGDAGVPPRFDWHGSQNLGEVTIYWPRPEAIESGGERTLGYHDALVLPIEVAPQVPGAPVGLQATVDLGLCEHICVPAQLTLTAPEAADAPDPQIVAAQARVPEQSDARPTCRIEAIDDGMRLTATLPGHTASEVAMELVGQPVWVSQPELSQSGDQLIAQSDFVAEDGKPFDLDAAQLRLTLIEGGDAIEFNGCDTAQ